MAAGALELVFLTFMFQFAQHGDEAAHARRLRLGARRNCEPTAGLPWRNEPEIAASSCSSWVVVLVEVKGDEFAQTVEVAVREFR